MRLGIRKGSLSNWVQAAKRQSENGGGSAAMPPTVAELQAEVARLRKELARTEMDAYFGDRDRPFRPS